MSRVILYSNVRLPRVIETLEERDFRDYLTWERWKKDLDKFPIKRFRNSAFDTTGFTAHNRPEKTTPTPLKIGNEVEFEISTGLTTKRPAYSEINEEFGIFLKTLSEQYEKGILGKGYRTINNKPYVLIDMLEKKLENDIKNILEGKEGIKQTLTRISPENPKVPAKTSIAFDRDYSKLTESNARLHIGAYLLKQEGDRRTIGYKDEKTGEDIRRFKKLLLEDSFQLIGGKPKEEGVYSVPYPFENIIFVNQLEVRKNRKHKDIVYSFIKPAPEKRIQKRSKIGDFVKINMIKRENAENLLREKEQIDDQFMNDYKPTIRKGKIYVSLDGIRRRLTQYNFKLVSPPNVEQNIYITFPEYIS